MSSPDAGAAPSSSPDRPVAAFLVSLLAVAVAAVAGGYFTSLSVGERWYPTPSWAPPDWLFGPVWTVLYLLMAVAAWLTWRRHTDASRRAISLYAAQLLLNIGWTVIFFGLRQPFFALIELALLWLAVLFTLIAFWRQRPLAGVLLLPYLAWITFAGFLNAAIARMTIQ